MQEHNTKEIRAAARQLDNIADQLQTLRSSGIVRISKSAKPLMGDTANAIQDRLEALTSDILALKKGVDQCAADLYEYARRLDIADEKAKTLIASK